MSRLQTRVERHTSKVVWKDSKELGMARAKTSDGSSTYVVARYSPAGNVKGKFQDNVFPSSREPKVQSSRSSNPTEQQSRITEQSSGNPGGTQTRVVVKETRTQTPEGVRIVKTTTTYTSSGSQTFEETKWEDPTPKLNSLNISDGERKPKISGSSPEPQRSSGGKAQQSPKTERSEPVSTGPFQEQALQLHNNYRRLHQVPDLSWSNELTRGAQTWADKLARANKLQHASPEERNKNGENLAYFGGRVENIAKQSVDMWYDEEKKYQYKKPGFKSGTGHFTQVVWKGTEEVGMAWAKSPDGKNTFIVARYRPAGNMMSAFKENVFPPKK